MNMNVKYTTILFDLDDTILDFSATEKNSLPRVFSRFGYDFDAERQMVYEKENRALWNAFERGEITLDTVLDSRFYLTMKHFETEVDGHEWDLYYRSLLSEGLEVVDGARELCEKLYGKYRLFIVTNGVETTQLSRLSRTGFDKFFEDVFISQRIGCRKPEKGFFDYVKSHIKDFCEEETLIVGDSLSTDISGGKAAGLDTCLFDGKHRYGGNGDIKPTFVIHTLSELCEIL